MRGIWAVCSVAILAACGDDTAMSGGGGSGTGTGSGGASTTSTGDAQGCDLPGSVDPSEPTGAWSARAALPGGPRQETAVAELDGKVYLVGGLTPGGLSAAVEIYDPATDSWANGAPLPRSLHHANLAAVAGKLYVVGFLEGGAFVARGEGFAYDPAQDAWASVAPMPAGTERGAAATAVVGGRVLVAGGFRDGSVSDASIYDPATDTWEIVAPLPVARDHGAAATVGGIFYAIGGRASAFEPAVYAFDPAVGAWCAREPMPTPRAGIAAAVVGSTIVVVGGEGSSTPDGVFTEVEAFDPATNTWSSRTPLDEGRHGTGAATVDGVLYLPGGADVFGLGAVADVSAFAP